MFEILPNQLKDAKRVQAILQGTANCPRPACANCRIREGDLPQRMLRCARCRAAHYCSTACQRKHFDFHKQGCKYTAQLRTRVEQGQGGELAGTLSTLGDEMVKMGYRETDTMENGSGYYRQALCYYIQALALDKEAFFHITNPMEDKVLFLLALLGGDQDTIQEWTIQSDSPRRFLYQAPAGDVLDVTFQMVAKLLIWMRNIVLHRRQNQESSGDPPHKKEIEELVESLKVHGKGDYLVQLRDRIPLNPRKTPELFRGGPGTNSDGHGPTTIPEFWFLYQDCFFLTPGLNSVLHEFVPEEDSVE